jgi:GNAT superfamily N-acetyltransferase
LRPFFDESLGAFGWEADEESILKTFEVLVDNHIMLVAIVDGEIIGTILSTIGPMDFNYSQKMATEIVWFVAKEHRNTSVGIKLFREYEKACIEEGANFIAMGYMENLQPDKLRQFYEKRGYKNTQTQYIRRLK